MNEIVKKITAAGVATCMVAVLSTNTVMAYTKEETVYSRVKNDGATYETIVNEHIKNKNNLKEIKDSSILTNIENVNGEETYTKQENQLVWKAEGNDIYYQGKTTKELPIEIKIVYKLDGKEILAQELVGKNGNVEICINFKNREKHEVIINEKTQTMYTPFTIVAGAILDNTKMKNIEITNGKTIDNGKNTIAMGIAVPGMQESLALDKEELEIPEQITFKFDTENFEIGEVMIYCTPKIIEDEQVNRLDELDEIFKQVKELQDSSKQLVNGANELKNGVQTLNENTSTLENGASKIAEGTSKLESGSKTIANNMSKITSGTDSLVSGGKSLKQGIDAIKSQLPTQKEVAKSKTDLNTLNTTNSQTIKKLEETNIQITSEINSKIEPQLKQLQTNIANLKKQIEVLEKAGQDVTTLKTTVTALETSQTAMLTLKATMSQQKTANEQLIVLLQKNNEAVIASTSELDSIVTLGVALEQVSEGIDTLQNGAKQLQTGSKQLQTGVNTLASSTKELSAGAKTLSNGTKQLSQGTNTLEQGSVKLSDGMEKFDKEGIQKIANLVNHDLKDLKARIQKLQELANDYKCFAQENDVDIQECEQIITKFVILTDEIKQKEGEKAILPKE